MTPKTTIIRYSEVGLKGQNRKFFENKLRKNIARTLSIPLGSINREYGQLVISHPPNLATKALAKIFGIAWFAPASATSKNVDRVAPAVTKLVRGAIKPSDTFAVRARRALKTDPVTSLQLEQEFGQLVKDTTKASVDLTSPDHTLHIYWGETKAYLYLDSEKISGPGGLPVGVSGRVLCLLSGGFDSAAAGYLLAKRGASVDFLHFHVYPDSQQVLASKLPKIWNDLSNFTYSSYVYLSPYTPYQLACLSIPSSLQKYELVTFRRLMVRVAQQLAAKHNYQALVLGDSLGQVASQTLSNIAAVDSAVSLPLLRPLISHDKQQTVDLIKQLGLESYITADYKDCCSLISRHPATTANLDKISQLESTIHADTLVDTITSATVSVPIKNPPLPIGAGE